MRPYNFGDFIIALLRHAKRRWFYYIRDLDTNLSLDLGDELYKEVPVVFEMANFLFWDRVENYEMREGYLAWERYPAYAVFSYQSASLVPIHYLNLAMYSGLKKPYNKKTYANYYYYDVSLTLNLYAVRFSTLEEMVVNVLNDARVGNSFVAIRYPTPDHKINLKVEWGSFIDYKMEFAKTQNLQTHSINLKALAVPLFAEPITRSSLETKLNSITIQIQLQNEPPEPIITLPQP